MASMPNNTYLETYNHTISDILLTADGFEEPIKIRKDFVRSLIFVHDYENNITPKVQLICKVSKNDYERVILNTDTLTATFDVYQINSGRILDSNVPQEEDMEQEHLWESFTLKAMNANELSTSQINKLRYDSEVAEGENDTIMTSQDTIMLTLYLYDNTSIQKSKISKYFILNGGKNDVIYRFFQDRGIDNILMTPTDNTNQLYSIPYGSLKQNFEAFNSLYGIYSAPYLFYMDFGCTYILDKSKVGETLRINEPPIVTIYLDKETEAGYTQSGSFCDTENNMYILNTNNFNVTNNDADIDYAIGGTIKTVISGTGEVKVDKIGDFDVERIFTVDNANQHSQLIYSIKESRRNMVLTFSNIDIDIITPNKKFQIITDDATIDSKYKISGTYRVSSNMMYLKRNSENYLSMSTQIVLRKIPE